MADLSFTTSNQIIRDLYDTPQEAIEASKRLGCDGYRTYLINGDTKYVPCSSYILYEKALRYTEVQGKIGAFGSDTFGDKLVGYQFANSKSEIQGDPYFTMGNFSINKSVKYSPIRERDEQIQVTGIQNDSIKKYTVDDIAQRNLPYFTGKPYIETLRQRLDKNISVKVLFDKRKLDNYVLFSSLKERIKNTLVELYNQFPAAMTVRAISFNTPGIVEYASFPLENRSEFKINLFNIFNPFNIEFTATGSTAEASDVVTQYRNFSKTYSDYVVFYKGVEYPIISATLPQNPSDEETGIQVSVLGDPFSTIVSLNNEASVNFYIKPKTAVYNEFYDNLSDLSAFLLYKNPETGDYESEFVLPKLTDAGEIVTISETMFFPKYDDVNIDLFSDNFDKYTTKLNDLAESYDSVKTNLIARFLTTDSLKEFDTEDRKLNLLLQLYGKTFDDVKKYIDGITFMRNVSYNKIANVPDLLIKNYASMLGLKTFEIEDEDSLIESLFDFSKDPVDKSTTPAELDIEIWRRILINSIYLFKSKGTRKSIEFILKLVGLPEEIFDVNEYIYVAERKIDVASALNKIYESSTSRDPFLLLDSVPFTTDGYPDVPKTIRYQEGGGFIREDKSNIGAFDFGKSYIDAFKKFDRTYLFDLQRTVDNVKSWVHNENTVDRLYEDKVGYTEYSVDHSDLIINSKELEIYLASNKVMDVAMYRQYVKNIGMLNANLNIPKLTFNANEVSFNRFIQKSLDNFINPKTRKTIKTYPSLSKIYFDYLKSTNNPITSSKGLEFLQKFDTSWVKLVEQFVPATAIVNAGKKIQNSTFMDNKFVHKYGMNTDVNWLGTDGSEFQNKALKPVYLGSTDVTDNVGDVKPSLIGEIPTFDVTGRVGTKLVGLDPTINEYFGVYYTMFEYCNDGDGRFYVWEPGINYAAVQFNGAINAFGVGATRYGVFAVYDNELYRLNTNRMFSVNTPMNTTGATSGFPPNKATLTVGGLKIWDHIPRNVDSRNILFKDVLAGDYTGRERQYYMNSIGKGLAYIQLEIDFDCPPPKPHVCYFDIGGKTLTVPSNTPLTYIDETGVVLTLKQPRFYGYSKNRVFIKPAKKTYGTPNNWAVPYRKRFNWIDGKTYYKNEIIVSGSPLNPVANMYLVTGTTVTGTTTYPVVAGSGLAIIPTLANERGGMYEKYGERTKSDPFMHIDPAFISRINLDPNKDIYSINLTKSLNLLHIFTGSTQTQTYRVNDNIVNNELFISDSISINVDGFYSLNTENNGPFYILKDSESVVHTLEETLLLQPNTNNFVSIQSLNENFAISSTDFGLVETNPGYYLITNNSFLRFYFQLYFESDFNTIQTVKIKLLNSLGFIYDEQTFDFNGDDDATDRLFQFDYQGFFNVGERIYLSVEPVDIPCTLSRYEKIEYDHQDLSTYNALEDPRFRLNFTSGNVTNFGFFDEGLSIKPTINTNDVKADQLLLKNSANSGIYSQIPLLNITHTLDPVYIFNKLFQPYYDKFKVTSLTLDTRAYDKEILYDKIDFKFKVRSKEPAIGFNQIEDPNIPLPGFKTDIVENELEFKDYYLGNTQYVTEVNGVTNAITIGKDIGIRKPTYKRNFNYQPRHSYYKNTAIDVTNNNIILGSFVGYNTAINDYNNLLFNGNVLDEIKQKKRFIVGTPGNNIAYGYYENKNSIFDGEIYKKLLEVTPKFTAQVINYELNDLVKVTIDSYKEVVETTTGTTVVVKTIEKIFVCINDIHESHCLKFLENGLTTVGRIHEIYQPLGSRSCFVELEKYVTNNYTPWGYEIETLAKLNNSVYKDYVGANKKSFTDSGTLTFDVGDIFKIQDPQSNKNELVRYVYPKPLKWVSGQIYERGDFVRVLKPNSTTVHHFFYAKQKHTATNANQPVISNVVTSTHWVELTNPFSAIHYNSTVLGLTTSWVDLTKLIAYSSSVFLLPKTLPVPVTSGNENKPSISKSTLNTRYYYMFQANTVFHDFGIVFNDKTETGNALKVFKLVYPNTYNNVTYNYDPSAANPVTTGGTDIFINIKGQTRTTDYKDYWGNNRLDLTNIYLIPKYTGNALTSFVNYHEATMNPQLNIYPLFERLGRIQTSTTNGVYNEHEQNNPDYFATNFIYNPNSLFLTQKYAVNRGVLYKAMVSGSTSVEPYNSTNWTERDFCLINNFIFYKDRTKVTVFESDIKSLTDEVKNNLYFYKSNLTLKNGFTNRSFSGTTIDQKLLTALDKFYDITDTNRLSPESVGQFDFRLNGGDVIMDYYYDKDEIGFPKTGEYLAKVRVSNPCGHVATTYFGILFDTNIAKLDRQRGLRVGNVVVPENAEILPYVVRILVNQNGQANALLNVQLANTNFETVSSNLVVNKFSSFDKSFNIIPETDVTFTLTYNTAKYQTTFGSAKYDDVDIFVNDQLIDSSLIKTTVQKVKNVETRTITLKNVNKNSTISINLNGVLASTVGNVGTKANYNVQNININNTLL